jgi:hypothetical protein
MQRSRPGDAGAGVVPRYVRAVWSALRARHRAGLALGASARPGLLTDARGANTRHVQFAVSPTPNYDHPLRESPGAGSLDRERPQEHFAASGRISAGALGPLWVRERTVTSTDTSGRFSGPLATAAIFLRHPSAAPRAHGRGVGCSDMSPVGRRGKTRLGTPRFPSARC